MALLCVAAATVIGSPARAEQPQPPPQPTAGEADISKGSATSDGDDLETKLPRRGKVKEGFGYPITEKQGFRLSFYWLAYESEYANEKYDTDIFDKHGYWIGRYPQAFVYELNLEGTGVLRDGRVLNYDGLCHYGIGVCFVSLGLNEHPLGRGVQNRRLEPFRSVAVDPRYIPIGAPIYVPEIVGVLLPDGSKHDGCLRADDQGGAIKFGKLDFFVESYFNFKFLADQLWWRLKATPHLDEPRCEYLRVGEPKERINERTDWNFLHRTHKAAMALKAKRAKRPPSYAAAHRATTTVSALGSKERAGKPRQVLGSDKPVVARRGKK